MPDSRLTSESRLPPRSEGNTSNAPTGDDLGGHSETRPSVMGNQTDHLKHRKVAVLGATGSIGRAAIEVIDHLANVDDEVVWQLEAISGHQNMDGLAQILDGRQTPLDVALTNWDSAGGGSIPANIQNSSMTRSVHQGPDGLVALASASETDTVVASVIGAAGLASTLEAAKCGKRIALANKEALVVAGPLITKAAQQNGASLFPVDSEHSAIWQALGSDRVDGCCAEAARPAEKLILTASGGPFRTWTQKQMEAATPEQAMQHPTWTMGNKITIDSATMMNKALEIIEARWLFDFDAESIEVMIHPQSVIHSMIQWRDGSVISQMGPPDMKLPIQYALTAPRRLPGITPSLDRQSNHQLELLVADPSQFPALSLGFEVARVGGTAGAVVNAANEIAVDLFLKRKIRFTDIVAMVLKTLHSHSFDPNPSLDELLKLDRWARSEVCHMAGISQ